jgi:hypothetical protein
MKSPYEIIRTLVESLILPKYPFLKLVDVDSYLLTNVREYDVRFHTKKKLEPSEQAEIFDEIKTLFRMAGLNERESIHPNKIHVWFKHPRAKEFSIHLPNGYLQNYE